MGSSTQLRAYVAAASVYASVGLLIAGNMFDAVTIMYLLWPRLYCKRMASYYYGHFGLKDIKHIAAKTAETAKKEMAPHVQDIADGIASRAQSAASDIAAKAQMAADGAARIADEVRENAAEATPVSYYGTRVRCRRRAPGWAGGIATSGGPKF